MTVRTLLALSFAATLFAAGLTTAADAATPRHAVHHARAAHGSSHAARTGRVGTTDADRSADSLNAQSLTRAQGVTQ